MEYTLIFIGFQKFLSFMEFDIWSFKFHIFQVYISRFISFMEFHIWSFKFHKFQVYGAMA